MENKENTFENNIKQLEEIVQALDSGEAPLNEMLIKFEEGMELVRSCRDYLDKAEQKVIDITKKNSISEE